MKTDSNKDDFGGSVTQSQGSLQEFNRQNSIQVKPKVRLRAGADYNKLIESHPLEVIGEHRIAPSLRVRIVEDRNKNRKFQDLEEKEAYKQWVDE